MFLNHLGHASSMVQHDSAVEVYEAIRSPNTPPDFALRYSTKEIRKRSSLQNKKKRKKVGFVMTNTWLLTCECGSKRRNLRLPRKQRY